MDKDIYCEICNKQVYMPNDSTDKTNAAHLDHNHTTGETRGILCSGCNIMIGFAKENISILKSRVKYLEKYNNT